MENEIKNECMICWEECDEQRLRCKCKGTNGYVHTHCMKMSKSIKCPHCRDILWYNIINRDILLYNIQNISIPRILRVFWQNLWLCIIIILFLTYCDYCDVKIKQKQEMSYIEESTCHALPWAVEQAKAICCYFTLERGEVCRFGAILNRVFPVFGIF